MRRVNLSKVVLSENKTFCILIFSHPVLKEDKDLNLSFEKKFNSFDISVCPKLKV